MTDTSGINPYIALSVFEAAFPVVNYSSRALTVLMPTALNVTTLLTAVIAETARAENAENLLAGQIAALTGGASIATLRQVQSWLAANSDLYAIDNAIPADIANPVTIQWRRGQVMDAGDGLYTFIQTTLGYSSATMAAAFLQMQGYAP